MTRNRATGVRTSAAIRVGKITASETLGFATALVLTALGASTAAAQDWPTKAIRAIVPLTAGSATDMIGRTVLDQLSQQLGQPIIVENRPGAGNTIGMATRRDRTPTAIQS
jgi:tripartite-type tricarboxylate transporter receptor subunit TctC